MTLYGNPTTPEEAKKKRYGSFGWFRGGDYCEGHCAFEVRGDWTGWQCEHNSGHGPGGLYCKQHAKKVKP